ncbi:MAG: hypothetical protein SGILL_004859 [Bacillariaceae sp.]
MKWLLLGERLEAEAAAASQSAVDNTNNPDADAAGTASGAAHLQCLQLAARIGRLANIQCAAAVDDDDGNANGNNDSSAAATKTCKYYSLQHLLRHTQNEFGTAESQPLVDLLLVGKKKNNNTTPSQQQQQKPVVATTTTTTTTVTSIDIDAFFQEYPECIRDDWGVGNDNTYDFGESSDSDESDGSVGENCDKTLRPSSSSSKSNRKKKKKKNSGEQPAWDAAAAAASQRQQQQALQQQALALASTQKPSPSKDQENQVPPSTENPYQKKKTPKEDDMDVVDLTQPPPPQKEQGQTQQSLFSSSQQQQQVPGFQYTPASPNSGASSTTTSNATTEQQHNSSNLQQVIPQGQGHGRHGLPQQQQQQQVQVPPPPQGQQQQQYVPQSMIQQQQQAPPTSVNNTNNVVMTNPYASQQQQRRPAVTTNYPQRQQPQQQIQNHQSAWQNHVQEQNPFQTAREMAHIGGGGNSDDQWNQGGSGRLNHHQQQQQQNQQAESNSNSYRQWGQPPPPAQQQQGNNPYGYSYEYNNGNGGYEEPPPIPQQPIQGGPHIPNSLRQKFRVPSKIGNDNNNGNNNSSNQNQQGRTNMSRNTPNNKGGSGQGSNRPSSSGGGQQRNNNSNGGRTAPMANGKQSNADEEELPEELQHLDKELVKKIQNEIMESGETVTFDDIAGLHEAKQTVCEVVVWPMQRPDVFTGLRRAPNGLLLFGPPGTGKTLIGKAIANETKATFFSISSSSLTSKWIGEGEKLVKTLFAVAAYNEPAVVFIDEIDSLLTQRKATENEASRRIKTEFLVQLDGAGTANQGRVLTIGATNRPQELDEAARRRFTKRMYIPLPTESDRQILLNVMLKNNKHGLSETQIEKLAKDTQGFSGADLKALCTDAAMGPIRELGAGAMTVNVEEIPPISFKHFKKSLRATRPSVSPDDITQYIEWDRVYGSTRAEQDEEDDDDDDDEDEE